MKFMPPKPNRFFIPAFSPAFDMSIEILTKEDFDAWYAREIAPLFENAVEMYGDIHDGRYLGWGQRNPPYGVNDTHSGAIINIKPIKKESAEDLLREMVDALRADLGDSIIYSKLFQKAKAYLERQKK